jgi:prepilin-type processing-associated H-X9-DG protein
MKAVRAERFKEILNTFHCPSQQTIKAILYGAGLSSSPDRTDFTTTDSNWTALSYLMPVHFQFFGQNYKDQALATLEANPAMVLYPRTAPDSWEALHETYKPLITRVGTPADKVAIADGTRYLTDTDTLDFDPSPDPGLFGSFTSAGAWWCGSTEYGVKSGTKNWNGRSVSGGQYPLAQGRNMELSYRHGPTRGAGLSGSARDNKGQINALFFDGSVRRLNDRQSRDPRPWYPKGTRITKAAEGMTDDLTNGSRVP